jgi:hypothetical protein
MRRKQPTTAAAAAEMKVTLAVTEKTTLAILRGLQLQLQLQVMPEQAHLHVQWTRTAAAASSEQSEAVAFGSAVHAIWQHVILFPALRGCAAAHMLRLSCSQRRSLVTMCTTCQVT